MDLVPGSIIAGRYRIDARVGAGGMGEVWLGEHIAIGMKVAIKTLLAAAAYDQEVVARFRREANLLGRIRSDHVARVVDFIQDPHVGLVLVMEYIEGLPLSKTLHQRRLTVEEAIDLGCDVVGALCDLHRAHIIHRDMKPGNVIMEPQPNGKYRGIVVDFGMGRIESTAGEDLEQTNLTRADMALGTLEYMAPEQILNSRDVTAASDLYAVGAMLYRAIAGRHIFGDAQDTELARAKLMTDAAPVDSGRTDRIAQGFAAVVMRGCKRRPQERYQKAEEMLHDLMALQDAVRAQAFEHSGARHLLGTPSIAPPAPQAAPQPPPQQHHHQPQQQQQYAQQQQQQQQYAQSQGHHPSQPHAPASAVSASMSAAAPISLPVKPTRKMSSGAVAALTALLVLLIGAVALFIMRAQLGLVATTVSPAMSQTPAASARPLTPPPPAVSAAAAPSASADADEGMEIEEAAPAATPTASLWGKLPSTAPPPAGTSTTASTGAATGTSTAPRTISPSLGQTSKTPPPAPVPTNIKF